LKYQFSAVLMALPFADDLYVDASFDCARDEHAAQAPMCELREAQPPASVRQSLPRFANREESIIRPFPVAQLLDQRTHLWVDREDKAGIGFAAVEGDLSGFR
jgi:hypothetical protein